MVSVFAGHGGFLQEFPQRFDPFPFLQLTSKDAYFTGALGYDFRGANTRGGRGSDHMYTCDREPADAFVERPVLVHEIAPFSLRESCKHLAAIHRSAYPEIEESTLEDAVCITCAYRPKTIQESR